MDTNSEDSVREAKANASPQYERRARIVAGIFFVFAMSVLLLGTYAGCFPAPE